VTPAPASVADARDPRVREPDSPAPAVVVRSGARRELLWAVLAWVVILGLLLLRTVASRDNLNADGLSYLDFATRVREQGLVAAGHAYWSPLYPLLVAGVTAVVRPAPLWELTVVHALNACIGVLALLGAERCRRAARTLWEQASEVPAWSTPMSLAWWTVCGWAVVMLVGVHAVTPDLLVALIVFHATAEVCRLRAAGGDVGCGMRLGAWLGLGYLAKAAMLPLGAMYFAGAALALHWHPEQPAGRSTMRRAARVLLPGVVVWIALAAPQVIAVSREVGRLSFGETGSMNHAWFARGVSFERVWRGDPASGASAPAARPAPRLHDNPAAYLIESRDGGTFPLWFAPHRWTQGMKADFSASRQLKAVGTQLRWYLFFLVPYIAVLVVVAGQGVHRPVRRTLRRWVPVALPVFAALAMYSLVLVEHRYVGAFLALALLVALLASWEAGGVEGGRMVDASAWAVVVVTTILSVEHVPAILREANDAVRPASFATASARLGANAARLVELRPGDRVAVPSPAYANAWARYARTPIGAVIDRDSVSLLARPLDPALASALASAGLRAVVVVTQAPVSADTSWRRDASGRVHAWPLAPRER
jgi:hypothetical protein